jgi:hypothetical protein
VALTVIAAAMLGFFVWRFTRTPSADEAYDRIAQSVDRGEASATVKIAIDRFVQKFPEDSRVDEVADWGLSIEAEQRRRRMRLERWIGGTGGSPEELLMRRATDLAQKDPLAGAEALVALSRLLRAGADPSPEAVALAEMADRDAERLRTELSQERRDLAAYFARQLAAAQNAEDKAAVASAVIALAPPSPETREVIEQSRSILAAQPTAANQGSVAPSEALR